MEHATTATVRDIILATTISVSFLRPILFNIQPPSMTMRALPETSSEPNFFDTTKSPWRTVAMKSSASARISSKKIKHSLGKSLLIRSSSLASIFAGDDASLQSTQTARRRFQRRGSKSPSMFRTSITFDAPEIDRDDTSDDIMAAAVTASEFGLICVDRNDEWGPRAGRHGGSMSNGFSSLLTPGPASDTDASSSLARKIHHEESFSSFIAGTSDGDASSVASDAGMMMLE